MRKLQSQYVVRSDGADVGEPFAEHAEFDAGDDLSGHWDDRVGECFGRPGHGSAVQALWCDLGGWEEAGGLAQGRGVAGVAVRADGVYAGIEQAREAAVRGVLCAGDGSEQDRAGADGGDDRGDVAEAVWGAVSGRRDREIDGQ